MAVVSFTPYQRLKSSDLNLAFSDCVSLSAENPQHMEGSLTLSTLDAAISIETQQLLVTGAALFSSTSALAIPAGTTFERPSQPTFGMLRANSDAGTIECMLANGNWATMVTTSAATTPVAPPVTQSGIQFGQATSTAIPLGWVDPSGGTGPFKFQILYRLAGTSNWIIWLSDVVVHNTTISGLLPASRYEFEVMSFNASGSATSAITATNTLGFLPGGPSNVTTSSPTSSSIGLTWLTVQSDSPISYQVEYALLGASSWTLFNGASMDAFTTVTGLTPNSTYNFQVTAKTLGASFTSLVTRGVTTAAATVSPNLATGLTFVGITDNGFTLSWTPPSAGTMPVIYQVQYQLIGTIPFVNYRYATTATSVTVSGLNSGSGYNVRVQTVNSAGASLSDAKPVTTAAAIAANNSVAGNQSSGGGLYPLISAPSAALVTLGSALPITGITVVDPSATYLPGTLVLVVTCGTGHITMTDANGNMVASSDSANVQYSGTLANIQEALQSLVYTALVSGSDNITISITDQLIQTETVTITTTVVTGTGSPPISPPPGGTPPPTVTTTGQPTDGTGTTASRMRTFLDGFGINVRLEDVGYNGNYTLSAAAGIENKINYLGGGNIKLLREPCATNLNGTFLAQVAQNCNAKYVLTVENDSPGIISMALMQQMATQFPTFVAAFEGIREVTTALLPAAAQFQPTVYADAHSLGLPAWQLTPLKDIDFNAFGTPPADAATTICNPPFTPNGYSTSGIGLVDGYLPTMLANASIGTPGSLPKVVSEFGWNSFPVGNVIPNLGWVDENVQASYLLEFIFSAFKLGARNYFYNELMDIPFGSSPDDIGQTTGLFNVAGVQKRAGIAVHNMYQILNDLNASATSFSPGQLNYTVAGKPAPYVVIPIAGGSVQIMPHTGYQDVVFQRSIGDFWIVMWNEQLLNSVGGNNVTINVPTVPITVSFGSGAKTVNVYDPLVSPSPQLSRSSVTSVAISLPAHPIFVQVIT